MQTNHVAIKNHSDHGQPVLKLRVLAMHEAKSVNTQSNKNLNDTFFYQWSIDEKRTDGKKPRHGRTEILGLAMVLQTSARQ